MSEKLSEKRTKTEYKNWVQKLSVKKMSELIKYIVEHAVRGACMCGECVDTQPNPEECQPRGHTVDMQFFKVSLRNNPSKDDLLALIKSHKGEFNEVDLLDGNEHNYIEIGGWIGDQGLALTLMGMGELLGIWELLTPNSLMASLP